MSDTAFVGSIPDIYDDYLVPLIFEGYAEDLARRTALLGARDVLETAAGSGVVSRALARALAAEARITVTDLNPPMIHRARSRLADDARFAWQACDAQDLPFADGAFDAVVCQFGAMFFPDRVRGYAEALRVLRCGGAFFFNMWYRIETSPFADVVTQATSDAFPGNPTQFLARTPHGHGDTTQIRMDLAAAGFRHVRIETVTLESTAQSARDVAVAYCQGTPLRGEIEARDALRLEEITDAAEAAVAARWGAGPVTAPITAHVIGARP